MNIVHQIDDNNLYVTDVILKDNEAVPSNCVDVHMPEGIFLPAKFENGQWSTTLTQDEINAKLDITATPSEIETLKKQQELIQQALDQIILGGAL